ncbi:MAG: 16S rRNA (cytosine(1402)-N(4))-methyltransferase RsmH [Spirochaetales bacterium]|nr:16S rRNA (cytosine(1402)-N(4))-methyltransferase RsmH [Spirochaetales bacterium]
MTGQSTVDIVHTSVLRSEAFEYLVGEGATGLYIDATLGEGGHAEYFLKRNDSIVIAGVDADESIMRVARKRLEPLQNRVSFYLMWFNQFFAEYPEDLPRPEGILFDLGISTFHYEKGERGFSFSRDEKLDMRLQSGLEISAADIVNEYPESELADLIFEYGEERLSRQIAKGIVTARRSGRITSSLKLADIVWHSVPPSYRYGRIHPATRTFQALRIAVNGELVRLEQALDSGLSVLKVGGRMAVISFHSLEDRIVKRFFAQKNKSCTCPPEWPMCKCGGQRIVDILTRKPVRPGAEEVSLNAPSRSARLRVIEKVHEGEL